MKRTSRLTVIASSLLALLASSPMAAPDKAASCTACHGGNGVSVSGDVPNLAGQKEKYLASQLTAFRSGKRANALMGAIAAQLGDDDIAALSAHFSSLPAGGEASALTYDAKRIQFPEGYADSYTFYTTSSRADNNTVRFLYANDVAMQAAAEPSLPNGAIIVMEVFKAKLGGDGKPVIGSDGIYEKAGLAGYAVMEKQAGFGDLYPAELRNGDWTYAFFGADKQYKPGINEAKCLACHQPLGDDDYRFSTAAMRAHAGG